VPQYCTEVEGDKALLLASDVLSLHELFHALLLPGGNDAALVLADYFGSMVDSDFKSSLPKSN
jgi:D-alanyl-D-alanine carboxypeptidase